MPGRPRGRRRLARTLALDGNPLRRASDRAEQGSLVAMFVLFSSRLGILGSIAVSVVITLILLVVFRVIR